MCCEIRQIIWYPFAFDSILSRHTRAQVLWPARVAPRITNRCRSDWHSKRIVQRRGASDQRSWPSTSVFVLMVPFRSGSPGISTPRCKNGAIESVQSSVVEQGQAATRREKRAMIHDRSGPENAEVEASLRSERARYAALVMHSRNDSQEITHRARMAFMQRFENMADPDRILDEPERARRSELLKRAYFVRLARLSAEARARKRRDLVHGAP